MLIAYMSLKYRCETFHSAVHPATMSVGARTIAALDASNAILCFRDEFDGGNGKCVHFWYSIGPKSERQPGNGSWCYAFKGA